MSTPIVTPNWFTSVMGTGVIAIAATSLPVQDLALQWLARAAWLLAVAVFATVTVLTFAHYVADRTAARRYLLDPAIAPFFGAAAMATMTVGTGTLLVGSRVIGEHAAVAIDGALWTVGTALGLFTAVAVPAIAFARAGAGAGADSTKASGVWLMPVVPPMVSAAAGALLVPHVPAAFAHTFALACCAMFGASAIAALAIIAAIWSRLAHHGPGEDAATPTLWIVLGPLGQSVTAAGLLADHAARALGVPQRTLTALAVTYGVPVLGFAMLWLAIAAAITIAAARRGLPFTLAWWAFTFPVGTCVTGASSLARHLGSAAIGAVAVALFALLLAGWALAATGTVRQRAQAWRPSAAMAEPALG